MLAEFFRLGQLLSMEGLILGDVWKLVFEAYGFSAEAGDEEKLDDPSGIAIGPRSCAVLIAEM